jgi:hypothetical protein
MLQAINSETDSVKSSPSSNEPNPARRVLEMLTLFYATMGNPPDLQGAVAAMATSLAAKATPEAIQAALDRCEFECFYPVRMPHIIQRLPGEGVDTEAEKRLARDIVEKFVRKYVDNDVHGNYGPDFGWYGPRFNSLGEVVKAASYPQLSDRILDTVRRTGGWKIYALMTNEDFPFVQKRFFEEYEAWSEVERISDRARLLEIPRAKELVAAKSMEPERPRAQAPAPTAQTVPISSQKARIMKAIANVGKSKRS